MSVDTLNTYKINTLVELERECCGVCGVQFAFPATMRDKCLKDRTKWFWCPNGHQVHYIGPSAIERERDDLRRQLAQSRTYNAQTREELADERKSHAATKGKLTKTRKRIQHGVCPQCNRYFASLDRHMQSRHPEGA